MFSNEEQERIAQAIGLAESQTSGEIRICVEDTCKGDAMERAKACFHTLGMHKTRLRNGVLVYLSIEDHTFAIIGDSGIYAKVTPDFWNSTKDQMLSYFQKGQLTEGLLAGIESAGQQLKALFPQDKDDINELPNDMIFLNRSSK